MAEHKITHRMFLESLMSSARGHKRGSVIGNRLDEASARTYHGEIPDDDDEADQYWYGDHPDDTGVEGQPYTHRVVSPEEEAAPYGEIPDDKSQWGSYVGGHGRMMQPTARLGNASMKDRIQLVRLERQIRQLQQQADAVRSRLGGR